MADMYIEGYAIVYNAKTLLYEYQDIKYYEIIAPSALDGCDMSNVVLRYNHSDQVMSVAITKNRTLQLINEPIGLKIRAKLANTTVGRDLYEMVKEQYCNKMSFAFIVGEDTFDTNSKVRTITKIKRLIDISIVDMPAYPQTSVYVLDEARAASSIEVEHLKRNITESEINFQKELFKIKLEGCK